MKQAQKAEPPSRLRPPLFMVGQDSHGNGLLKTKAEFVAAYSLIVPMR